MPNGGSICCVECTYGRSPDGRCDVHGVKTSPFLLCRTFRMPGQSHSEARQHWPLVSRLEPGIVYEIENSYAAEGRPPQPRYRLSPCE